MESINDIIDLEREERFLSITTVSFDISILEMFFPLLYGHTLIIGDRRMLIDMNYLMKAINDFNITIIQATPLTWRALINSGWENKNKIKILCGGEKLEENLSKKLFNLSNNVWNLYGPTETTIWSSAHRLEYAGDTSIGAPLKNNKFYIFSEDMRELRDKGELYIGGDSVSNGYINNPKTTNERFIRNPFNKNEIIYKTGDIVKCVNNNYYCLGRKDFQLKINGHRIEPEEIEKQIEKIKNVDKAVVVTDDKKNLYAFVLTKNNTVFSDVEIKQELEKFLPIYMIPKKIYFVGSFPMTFNKKIDKNKLISEYINNSNNEYYSNKIEDIKKIWKETLKQDIDINTPYYQYEIDSLTIIELCIEMGKVLEDFNFDDLVKYKTIKNISMYYNTHNCNEVNDSLLSKRVKKILEQNHLNREDIRIQKISNIEEMMLNYSYVNQESVNFNDIYIFETPFKNIEEIRKIYYNIMKNVENLQTLYVFGENIKLHSNQFIELIDFEYRKIQNKKDFNIHIHELLTSKFKINEQSMKMEIIENNDKHYWIFIYPHIRLDEVSFFKLVDMLIGEIRRKGKSIKNVGGKTNIDVGSAINVTIDIEQKKWIENMALKLNTSVNNVIEFFIIRRLIDMNIIKESVPINYIVNLKNSIGNNISIYSIRADMYKNINGYIKRKKCMLKKDGKKILLSYNDIRNMSFDDYDIPFYHIERNDFEINVEIYNRNKTIDIIISSADDSMIGQLKDFKLEVKDII